MTAPIPFYVFVKDPARRPCKTRLARGLGDEGARRFYEAALGEVVERLGGCTEGLRPVLYVDPPESVERFPAALGWTGEARAQPRGDLGARILHAFEDAGGPAMVVGSDMPELGPAQLVAARDAMGPGRVVVGPCPDGGYYLLGVDRPRPELLEGVPWSTGEVLAATRARAEAAGLEVVLLEAVEDVDELEDLVALDRRLGGEGAFAEVVRELVGRGRG